MPDPATVNLEAEVERLRQRVADLEEAARGSATQKQLAEAAARSSSIRRNSPLAIIWWDTEFRVRQWNRSAVRIFGYTEEEAKGRHANDLIVPPDQQPLVDGIFQALLQQRGGESSDNRNVTKDGETILCRWNNCVVLNDAGEVTGVISHAEDITQGEQIKEELRRSEAFLQSVVHNTPSVILGVDKDYCIQFANRLDYGYTLDDVRGRSVYEFVPEEQHEIMRTSFAKAKETAEPVSYEVQEVRSNRWFLSTIAPVIQDDEITSYLIIALDIHDRRLEEEKVRRSEERFRVLVQNVPGVVYLCKNDRRYTMEYLSESVRDLVGIDSEEFLADRVSFVELYHPGDAMVIPTSVNNALRLRRPFHLKYRLRHAQGHWVWVEEHGQGVYDDEDQLLYLQGTIFDITAQKQQEEELRRAYEQLQKQLDQRGSELKTAQKLLAHDVMQHADMTKRLGESEGRFQAMCEASPVPVMISRFADGKILYGNQRLADLMQIPLDELVGKFTPDYYDDPEDREKLIAELGRFGFIRDYEIKARRPDGSIRWVSASSQRLEFEGEDAVLGCFLDVTQRQENAAQLRAERSRLKRMLELHERDRQLISYEIHDGLAQDLAGAKYHLQGLKRDATAPQQEKIDALMTLLGETHAEARKLIEGLSPPTLDEYGVSRVIAEMAQSASQSDSLSVTADLDEQIGRLAPALETNLFRVAQEALTNIQRHSQATQATIRLRKADDWVHLTVTDNGIGFDTSVVASRRYGLKGMQERAKLLQGQLSIDSTPGEGTSIHLELPLVDGLLPEDEEFTLGS